MHHMNHEELAARLEKRLDRLEEKLDVYLREVAENKADLKWVKGHIKLGLSAILAIATGLLTTAFRVFIKGA